MQARCSSPECTESAAAFIDDRALCRKHFLTQSYQRLESISAELHQRHFHERQADAAGHFLESCMRDATDIACGEDAPSNLEKAQVLDVLLWASELHARLRRGPRVTARVPIQVRSESPERPWEEKTETAVLSRHGAQIVCGHEAAANDRLTVVRLDNPSQIEVRVVWVSRKSSGELDVGIEFLTDRDFWGVGVESKGKHPTGEFLRREPRREEKAAHSPSADKPRDI